MNLFHRHKWALTDKTVIPPSIAVTEAEGRGRGWARMIERLSLGYVVLTFTCPCGAYHIEEH